jgi:hypothetical protein
LFLYLQYAAKGRFRQYSAAQNRIFPSQRYKKTPAPAKGLSGRLLCKFLFCLGELVLAYTAQGALVIIGQLVEGDFAIVFVTAYIANILLSHISFLLQSQSFYRSYSSTSENWSLPTPHSGHS